MASRVWKGSISFGLINIAVTLHKAEENKALSFSMLDEKDHAPIKYKKINGHTGKEVPYDRIIKGYEYDKDEYVTVTKRDFFNANPKATQTIDIQDFVNVDEINPIFFEKPYYVLPQKNSEKGYALLRDVLKKTGTVAVGEVVMHTKQHLTMIMAQGDLLVLENLRFAHNLVRAEEVAEEAETDLHKKYSPKEMQMAMALVKGMTAHWKPQKYKDTYYDDLMKVIHKKIKQGDSYAVEQPEAEELPSKSKNIIDLLPLLKKSLAQNQKNHSKKPAHGPYKSRKAR
jgi:DNA end-binding protein Ku